MRLAPVLCLIAATAAAPAMAATRGFNVPGFDRVRSNVPFDVHVHTGRKPGVVANGDSQVLDRLEVGVRGGELVIGLKPGQNWFSGWRGQRAVIDVNVPAVRGATLNGPGNIDVDRIGGREASLNLAGPGNIRIGGVQAGFLDVVLTGPGNIVATGRVDRVRIVGNGPGNVRFGKLAARDADVTLNGPGGIDAFASATASVRLRGPGDVTIAGRPRCQVEKSGPGSVRCG